MLKKLNEKKQSIGLKTLRKFLKNIKPNTNYS